MLIRNDINDIIDFIHDNIVNSLNCRINVLKYKHPRFSTAYTPFYFNNTSTSVPFLSLSSQNIHIDLQFTESSSLLENTNDNEYSNASLVIIDDCLDPVPKPDILKTLFNSGIHKSLTSTLFYSSFNLKINSLINSYFQKMFEIYTIHQTVLNFSDKNLNGGLNVWFDSADKFDLLNQIKKLYFKNRNNYKKIYDRYILTEILIIDYFCVLS